VHYAPVFSTVVAETVVVAIVEVDCAVVMASVVDSVDDVLGGVESNE